MSALCSPASLSSLWREAKTTVSDPLIRRLQGLVSLTGADIAALREIGAAARRVDPHVDLFPAGGDSQDALFVLEGYAGRYKQRRTGARQIIAYLLPGDFYDGDTPYRGHTDHAVGTLSTCLVARISHQALGALMAEHPKIAQALQLAKLVEAAIAREWIVNLGCRSGTERMAHLFCELMDRMDAVGLARDDSCPLPLTQPDLADTLGFSNVHTNRVLQELRHQGLIEVRGKRLTLLMPQRVRDLVEFNPGYLRTQGRSGEPPGVCVAEGTPA